MKWCIPLLVAALATANFALSSRAPSPQDRPVTASPFVVLHEGDELLRDRLHRAAALRHDAGEFLVADLTPALRASLEARDVDLLALPALGAGEQLFVLGATRPETLAKVTAAGGQVLLARGPRALIAAPLAQAPTFHHLERGRHLHGGLVPVQRTPMGPPRPFKHPGCPTSLGAPHPRVQAVVDQVDAVELEQTVVSLSAIPSRCASTAGAVAARDQIVAKLTGYGYVPVLQPFDGQYSENVVAELPGTTAPERIVVIGAHYDSMSTSCSDAPGAADNATGTAGVIEAARVLATGGPWEHTLRFVLYSAEEYGLIGSSYDADQSVALGEDIVAMLNTDMSAYRAPGDALDVDFVLQNTTGALREFCDDVGALYVPGWASTSGSLTAGTSDHQSYFSRGFPAVFYFEDVDQYSPYIHSSGDTHPQSTNDFALSEMIVKGIVAAAATLADPVDLAITHAPLADTQDPGPYDVACQVQSLTGANVTAVDLYYAVDEGPWNVLPMALQGSDWVAQIPSSGSPVTIGYYLAAADDQGGSEDLPEGADLGGSPFAFFVGQMTVHYSDDFEAAGDGGWTHGLDATQDDWHHDVVYGKAGDPSAAHSGQRLWGNDLGPSGWNGEYAANVSNWLRSPVVDLSAAQNVHVRYARWLTVEDALYDQAQIRVNGIVVWQNEAGTPGDDAHHTLDTSWSTHTVDVSAEAAGNPSVQVEFRLVSDGGLQFGGWNLDDFSLVSLEPIGCPPPTSYCTPLPNATGSPGVIAWSGSTSVTANDLVLRAAPLPPGFNGLFIYSPDQVETPLGNGHLCVGDQTLGFILRLPFEASDGAGVMTHALDNLVPPHPSGQITPGSTWFFQCWHRDPDPPAFFNFSDGLRVTFCP